MVTAMDTTIQRWRRVGQGSGPCNVLDGRYRVERLRPRATKWWVRDLKFDAPAQNKQWGITAKPNSPRVFSSMKDARTAAERLAHLDRSDA
jgi:hypothetical protein